MMQVISFYLLVSPLLVPDIVEDVMAQFHKKFGREYHLFSYVGHPEAEYVIALMGAGSQTVEECLPYIYLIFLIFTLYQISY